MWMLFTSHPLAAYVFFQHVPYISSLTLPGFRSLFFWPLTHQHFNALAIDLFQEYVFHLHETLLGGVPPVKRIPIHCPPPPKTKSEIQKG